MRGFSAREMLSQLPLRMANGGDVSSSLLRLANGGDVTDTLPPGEHSVSYHRAFEQNGQAGVQDYYQGLRDAAEIYLADADSAAGAEAYNLMIELGISTTDLINAGVGEAVLDRVFTLTENPTIDTFPLTNAESAFLRDPVLLGEAARLSATGVDGVAFLQQQARDYVAGILEGGITEAERIEMQGIATQRGHTAQDFEEVGVDIGILFEGTYCPPGSELEGLPIPTDGNCNPTSVPQICPPGTQLDGQPMPPSGDCNPEKFPTTQVCPAGSELAGQTIAIEASCDPSTVTPGPTVYGTTKVCPAGTARAGQTIPIADDCDASLPTTKVCPPGTKLANQTIGIADDCEGPGIYPEGEPALDTTFRESAPRTATAMPGQFDYTPAAKLLPATGSGLSWMPPSVTSRPRSLLSPTAIQQYGGMTPASSRFAQNRRGMDRAIMQAFHTADVYDPNAIRDFRQRARAGLFSTDDGAFSPAQFQSAFDTYLSLRPATKVCPAGTAREGQTIPIADNCDVAAGTGGQRPDSWWGEDSKTPWGPFGDSEPGAREGEGDFISPTDGAGTGYFGPITPVDLRYGVPGQFFAKGGPVGMSARNMLAQFANGGSVSTVTDQEPRSTEQQTESQAMFDRLLTAYTRTPFTPEGQRSMFGNVVAGVPGALGSVYKYGKDVVTADHPLLKLGVDLAMLRQGAAGSAKEDPLGFALDVAPVTGQWRARTTAEEYSNLANEARERGEFSEANRLEKLVVLAAFGMLPGARSWKAGLPTKPPTKPPTNVTTRAVDDLPASDSRQLLEELTGEGPAQALEVSTPRIVPEVEMSTPSSRMLDDVVIAGRGLAADTLRLPADMSPEEATTRRNAARKAAWGGRDMPETGRPVHAADMSPEEFRNITHNMYGHQGDLKTPQEMVARANRIGPEFQDAIRNITDQLGLVKSETYGTKELDSLLDKIDRGYKLDRVTDPIRTRILINTAEEADQAARMISDIMPVQDRGWQRIGESGYFDRKLNVLYTSPSGEKLIGEIQITLPRMNEAVTPPKGRGHRLYEVERELIRIYGSEDAIPDTHIRRFNWVRQEMKDMYSEIEASTDPNIVESILLKPEKDLTPIIPTTRARPPPAESTSARGSL